MGRKNIVASGTNQISAKYPPLPKNQRELPPAERLQNLNKLHQGFKIVGGSNVTVEGDPAHGFAISSTCPGEDQGVSNLPVNFTNTVLGACCFDDGSCSVTTQIACTSAMGTYQGDGTDCDPNPCPSPDCCSGGFPIVPLLNMQYSNSVDGSYTAPDPCNIEYTMSGSSGAIDLDLSSIGCSGGSFSAGVSAASFTFDTDPPGVHSPNCFNQYDIFLHCSGGEWTLQVIVVSSFSSGNCSICENALLINWGGCDSGATSLGADPRGTYHFDIVDLIIPTIMWSFDVTIT